MTRDTRRHPEIGIGVLVEVQAAPFSGAYECVVVGMERFRDQLTALHRSLTGEALLDNLHDDLHLRVEGDGMGHLGIEVTCVPSFIPLVRLTFDFVVDQTYLPGWIEGITDKLLCDSCAG